MAEVLRRLAAAYPDARIELAFRTPLELAVATILSAQCTDVRVNEVTPTLFRRFRTARGARMFRSDHWAISRRNRSCLIR